ncbi:YpiB family protein [Bacillus cereus]|uniref:UPF0302 domain-containing protein n=1 Tax=Bacillus cereus HuA2-1 TaxID=1053201 RepID=J8YHV9_BACCE|nr:YpiB family protein [Bacillus cereus]EJV82103.1 hypothetical protein IG3_03505 [Bacillus cereus HuA2-1]
MKHVPIDKKQVFMDFLLRNVLSRDDEGYRLLYTFNKYEKFAARMHFVENAQEFPYGIKISEVSSGDSEFIFHKHGEIVTESFSAFDHFNENTEEPIYIQINFTGKYSNELYREVVEDDDCTLTPYLNEEDRAEIDRFIKYQLIDYALDTKNEEMFRELISN